MLTALLPPRVSSPLPYFISELLFINRDKLENSTDITLDVLTFHPSHTNHVEREDDNLNLTPLASPSTHMESPAKQDMLTCENREELPLLQDEVMSNTDMSELASLSTVPPHKRMKLSGGGAEGRELSDLGGGDMFHQPSSLSADIIGSLNASPAWILDIDLDFFSTGNPYRAIYSEVRGYHHGDAVRPHPLMTHPTPCI